MWEEPRSSRLDGASENSWVLDGCRLFMYVLCRDQWRRSVSSIGRINLDMVMMMIRRTYFNLNVRDCVSSKRL